MTTTPPPRMLVVAKVLRVGLILVILATIVPYGAVSPSWFYAATFLNGMVFAATLAIPFRNMELMRVYRAALAVMVIVVAYLILQSVHLPGNFLAHSIWETVRSPLGIERGTISVNPAGTLASIPLIVHPFLIFMGALVLHQTNDAAVAFFRQVSFIGAGVAAFGLAQYFLFPARLLLGEKLHYLDSVTGTFVNRNSAATLFGVAALLLAAMVIRQFDEMRTQHSLEEGDSESRQKQERLLLGYLALFVLVLLAEFLTKSRGGLLATFPPLMLLTAWFGYSLLPESGSRGTRFGLAVAAVAALALLFTVLGAHSLFRLMQGGAEDDRWCIYQSAITAVRDNPWFGTGFGTFEEVFPVYRNPECGIYGLWDRAHNSFLEGYLGLGLPFAFALLFSLGYLVMVFLTGYRARRRYRIVPLAGLATLLLILLHSAVDFSLQIPGVSAYVAATLAAVVAISLARKRAGREITAELQGRV